MVARRVSPKTGGLRMTGDQVRDLEHALTLDEVWVEEPPFFGREPRMAKTMPPLPSRRASIASRVVRYPAVRNWVTGTTNR